MKNKVRSISPLLVVLTLTGLVLSACSTQQVPADKSGAQLWGENCVRCHNAPSPSSFSDDQWETVTMHMRVRANLNAKETSEIVDFLQMAN